VNNFEDLWAATVGANSKWVVSSAITVTTFLACIAYAMIIGDLFSAMAATAGVQVGLAGITKFACVCMSLCAVVCLGVLGMFIFLESLRKHHRVPVRSLQPYPVLFLALLAISHSSTITCCPYFPPTRISKQTHPRTPRASLPSAPRRFSACRGWWWRRCAFSSPSRR
jgi:amino acid permease